MRARVRLADLAALAVVATLVVAAALSGCSPKKLLVPDQAPQTSIFVTFNAADTVPHSVYHTVHLYWFGSDPDGYVTAYEYRFVFPGGNANPPWSVTTHSDSVFTIPDTTGFTSPTFEVRAIDNSGVRDPSPAVQKFDFTNQAPTVLFLDTPTLADTTFATQTVAWQGVDPDGDANLLSYRVWLDGNEASPHAVNGTSFTFPTADFRQGPNGMLRSGPRTAFVRAVDAGGRAGNATSCTWYVRSPVPDTLQRARLLLIDNVPQSSPRNPGADNYYNAAVARAGLPPGSWTVLRLATGRPFRSSMDLAQSLKLFDAVVWYRSDIDYIATVDTLLPRHADGLAAYLDAGGKFFFESASMINDPNSPGLLSQDFMRRYLDSDFIRRWLPITSPDSSADWAIAQTYADSVGGQPVTHFGIVHSSVFSDSLRVTQNLGHMRVFGVRDTNDVALWARDSTLNPRQDFDAPVGVQLTLDSGGRIVAVTLPLVAGNGYQNSGRFIDKIFTFLGIHP